MKYSKTPKSNSQEKILKAISRDEELTRNDGKWISMNRPHKNKKKYDRKDYKRNKDMSESRLNSVIRECVSLILKEDNSIHHMADGIAAYIANNNMVDDFKSIYNAGNSSWAELMYSIANSLQSNTGVKMTEE